MQKWLIGIGSALVAALGAGITIRVLKKRREKRTLMDMERAMEHVHAFHRTISLMRIEAMERTPILVPEAKSWIDRYAGSVAGEEFEFSVMSEGETIGTLSQSPREYVLRWRNALVKAQVHSSGPDEEPHVFERIHRTLARFMESDDETRP